MSTYRLYETDGEFICEAEFYEDEIEAFKRENFIVEKVGADNE